MKDRVVALFAGAGGLSAGFAAAGHKPTHAVDIDPDAALTYSKNLDLNCHTFDLATVDGSDCEAISLHETAFAVIGGPPCQGFSTAGDRLGTDPRNKLIFSYLNVVGSIQPRWFLFENVEGILTSKGGESISDLVQEFVRLGYWVRLDKVNFASFGLPQARKRVVIIGNRIGAPISMPAATHSFCAGKHKSVGQLPSSPSLAQALSGLGPAAASFDAFVRYGSPAPQTGYDRLMRHGNERGGVSLTPLLVCV